MAMGDCFYVTLGQDIWRNCSLFIRKRVKFETLRSQDVSKELLSDLVRMDVANFSDKFPVSNIQLWKCLRGH